MAGELDSSVFEITKDTLGKVITKPPLTEKLLSRPPFRYIHDIISEVNKVSSFFNGLFTPDELDAKKLQDKDAKIAFLQKAIDTLSFTTGEVVKVKPSKILSGQEADKTNEFLQLLGVTILKKLDSSEAIKAVLDGDKPAEKIKKKRSVRMKGSDGGGSEGEPSKQHKESIKSDSKSKDRDVPSKSKESSSKGKEKESSKTKETAKEEKTKEKSKEKDESSSKNKDRDESSSKDKDREESSKDRDKDKSKSKERGKTKEKESKEEGSKEKSKTKEKESKEEGSKEKSKDKDEPSSKDRDKVESSKDRDKEKTRSKDRGKTKEKESKEDVPKEKSKEKDEASSKGKERDESSKGKDREKSKEDTSAKGKDKTKEERKQSGSKAKEKEKSKSRSGKDKEASGKESDLQSKSQHKLDDSKSRKQSSKKKDKPHSGKKSDDDEGLGSETKVDRPPSAKGMRKQSQPLLTSGTDLEATPTGDGSGSSEALLGFGDIQDGASSPSHLAPSMGGPKRPGSARPAPPKIQVKHASEEPINRATLKDDLPPTVLLDTGGDADDDDEDDEDDEQFVVEDSTSLTAPSKEGFGVTGSEEDVDQKPEGALTKNIVAMKERLEGDVSKEPQSVYPTINEAQRRKEREMVAKEIEKLQASIQTLCKSANPLGKIMDYVQEDIDSMYKELEMWQAENGRHAEALQREESVTNEELQPLKSQLEELEAKVVEQVEMICAIKANILKNDVKTQQMLDSMNFAS